MGSLRLGLAQLNVTVGDLEGNLRAIVDCNKRARAEEVDLLVFPELTLTGYPPEDLLLQPHFVQANLDHLKKLIPQTKGITVVVGFVDRDHDLYNAAAVLSEGKWVGTYRKAMLPNYGVFDECRYFKPGREFPIFTDGTVRLGVTICEDIWHPIGPVQIEALQGQADLIVNLSASPFHTGRGAEREAMPSTRARDYEVILAFCNLVGGQDELVFDGLSGIWNASGKLVARARSFEEDLLIAEVDVSQAVRRRLQEPRWRFAHLSEPLSKVPTPEMLLPRSLLKTKKSPAPKPRTEPIPPTLEAAYRALVKGTHDYVRKNRFKQVVLGLSGGIDSALVACIAVDALGTKDVIGVFMSSQFSSQASHEDAQKLAEALNIRLLELPIDGIFNSSLQTLAVAFNKKATDKTEENLQARIRGTLLMALSNKFGWLVLVTGNKSEFGVGYATLYGDMAGGLAVLKDVPKTLVYELARWRNAKDPVIPARVFKKHPTAELRHCQRDEDDLPAPYRMLDPILKAYIEEDCSVEEIVERGFPKEIVQRVASLVNLSEYKRRQAPIGIKISPRAFGKDRRFPITLHLTAETDEP
ncbi:MAG: NAD+ synthase [Candidatus Fraserbacteria bacterium RBG_16_55_9]|uniref:Glutamine-dependent NAD(+) synthetase n=1 Tax=Fraserbacteria sp. (strain RBG_16_55_9) TaxID=1817864 RepID=A0A1F5UWE3_FRAXR|nr:MAG: NAD+ synthase [Candidatus Fraserbacteria bacterium RBG_16_55_9]